MKEVYALLSDVSALAYQDAVDPAIFASAKERASSSLTSNQSLLCSFFNSEDRKRFSNSLEELLNFLSPASDTSKATPSSLQMKNISKDDVPQDGGDINKKLQRTLGATMRCGQSM